MGLSSIVKSTHIQNDFVVSSVPASYAAGQHTIFTITGGPVWIKAMVEYMDVAMTAATDSTLAIQGTPMDNGASLIGASAAFDLVVSPLSGFPKLVQTTNRPIPVITANTADQGFGVIAGPGNGGLIQVTFAGVAMVAADRWSLHIVYQKLSDAALIS